MYRGYPRVWSHAVIKEIMHLTCEDFARHYVVRMCFVSLSLRTFVRILVSRYLEHLGYLYYLFY